MPTLQGPTDRGVTWESIPQCFQETVDFIDAGIHLGACCRRPMLMGALLGPAGGHRSHQAQQLDDLTLKDALEKPCLRRLGRCDGTLRNVRR